MRHHIKARMAIASLATFCAVSTGAQGDIELLKDLTAVIALLGLPCGQVGSATQLKAEDHIAICQDGNRYRVFINTNGRVVAQKQ